MEQSNYKNIVNNKKKIFKEINETDMLEGIDKITYNLIRTLVFTTTFFLLISIILGGGLLTFFFHTFITQKLIVPYILIGIYVSVTFIIKYLLFNGKKLKQILLSGILLIMAFFIIYKAFSLTMHIDYLSRYVIPINSYVSQITNTDIKKAIEDNINKDVYVYYIEIKSDTSIDNIHYNSTMKYKDGNENVFCNINFTSTDGLKDLKRSDLIKIKILYLLGGLIYIYLSVFILNEFKRITLYDSAENYSIN